MSYRVDGRSTSRFNGKRSVLLMAMIFAGLGCGTLRDMSRGKTTNKVSSDSSMVYVGQEKRSSSRRVEAVVMSRDSLRADYTFEVWPKGKFNYSLEKGFEGEALRFIVRGSQEERRQVLTRQSTNEDANQSAERSVQTQHKAVGVSRTQDVRRSVGWKAIIGCLVLGGTLMALVFGWRFLKMRLLQAK